MKGLRSILTAAGVAAALLSAVSAQATVVLAGVGSSAMFNVFAQTAVASCTGAQPKFYETTAGVNSSGGGASGSLWVVVDTGAGSSGNIWYYLNVDSVVGNRAYFKSETLTEPGPLDAASANDPGIVAADVFPLADPDITAAMATISGTTFNCALTDITPWDAEVMTARAVSLGYNNGANPIKGMKKDGTAGSVGVIPFAVANRGFGLVALGAVPIVVAVNKVLNTAGHFGNNAGFGNPNTLTNIKRFVLAGYLDSTFIRTRDAFLQLGLGNFPVVVLVREILSGTYTTMEFCVPNSLEIGSSIENAVATNPLDEPTGAGGNAIWTAANGFVDPALNPITTGGRIRALGTGAMVALANNANNKVDVLTWAFWSTANFAPAKAGNLRYIQVDCVDPILDCYKDGGGFGLFPAAVNVTLGNVRAGSYPIWSILRAACIVNPPAALTNLLNAVAAAAAGADFVPANQLLVFRSHRATATVPAPHNGNVAPEAGADAGGAIFTKNADLDFNLDFFGELINRRQ